MNTIGSIKMWILMLLFSVFLFGGKVQSEAATKRGQCGDQGDNVTWTLTDQGLLTITGTGNMIDYTSYDENPWYSAELRDSVFRVVVSPGVTSIGDYAFNSFSRLEDVSIPEGVTKIGSCAFLSCSSLTAITFPESLETIGSFAFESVPLTQLVFPSNLRSIGSAAFYTPGSLKKIYFKGDMPEVNQDTFFNMNGAAYYPYTWESVLELNTDRSTINWYPWDPASYSGEDLPNEEEEEIRQVEDLKAYLLSDSTDVFHFGLDVW